MQHREGSRVLSWCLIVGTGGVVAVGASCMAQIEGGDGPGSAEVPAGQSARGAARRANSSGASTPGAPVSGGAAGAGGGVPSPPLGGGSTPGVPTPGVTPQVCGGAPDPGYVGMRRLTRAEYDNTVRDLLGDRTRPAQAFPNDDAILAALGQISGLHFEKHEAAAERLINEAWTRDVAGTQSGARLVVCPPKGGDVACARTILATFARRAWRRPVTPAELEPFLGLVTLAERSGDDAATGVKLALQAILEAPEFLFRIEADTSAPPRPLTTHELATRLSYWLWSTTPDARLSQLADGGTLTQPAILGAEIERLLRDPRADAFVEGLAGHWLSLGSLASAQPDPALSGGFDEPLRQAMTAETLAFLRAFLREEARIANLLDADFTFVNDRLTRHYGLPAAGSPGPEPRKVTLGPGPRRGLLAHASLLTMTSGPTSTSPVKRGKFVSTFLLCTKPPAPPPGADTLDKAAANAKTERERLALHRANPTCAACHALMDPIGLGLENFDLVGRHRSRYGANGPVIDASGELAGGGAFKTFEELRGLLAVDARVPACLAQQIFTYAIGREPEAGDECVQRGLLERLRVGGRFTDLIAALAGSPPFLQRRAEGAGGAR